MPTSVRLDDETEQLLQRLANRDSRSKSEVIRVAIEALAREELGRDADEGVFDLVSDLLGAVQGGHADLSEDTGKRVRDLLAEKRESAPR